MNTERALRLADVIEGEGLPGVGFDMTDWSNFPDDWRIGDSIPEPDCGSVCCVAGMACLLFGEKGTVIDSFYAQTLLGLNNSQYWRLFLNEGDYIAPKLTSQITRAEAAAAIRRMVSEEGDLTPAPIFSPITDVPIEGYPDQEEAPVEEEVYAIVRH